MAEPIERAGYTIHHRGSALVGDSFTQDARRVLRQGGPVVLCGTVKAVGTGWAHRVIQSVQADYCAQRLFAVRMEAEAYLSFLVSSDTRIAIVPNCSTVVHGS